MLPEPRTPCLTTGFQHHVHRFSQGRGGGTKAVEGDQGIRNTGRALQGQKYEVPAMCAIRSNADLYRTLHILRWPSFRDRPAPLRALALINYQRHYTTILVNERALRGKEIRLGYAWGAN